MENQNNDLNIPVREAATLFDPKLFDGQRVPIDTVEKTDVADYYPEKTITGEDGKPQVTREYDPQSTARKNVIEITTKPLRKVTTDSNGYPKVLDEEMKITSNGELKPLVVRERFNLQKQQKEDGSFEEIISKHPKAALWQFMRKLEVLTLPEMKGKLVTITTVPSKKENDDRLFLTIAH